MTLKPYATKFYKLLPPRDTSNNNDYNLSIQKANSRKSQVE